MKKLALSILVAVCLFNSFIVIWSMPKTPTTAPLIQIAILLDTSNSMDGLINQAKTQIWKIVNELATAQKAGRRPRLEVALFQYGNNDLAIHNGYIQQVAPLTTDLDWISASLFDLKTNGGDEYCGQVIEAAVTSLRWSKKNSDLKLIVIAGNEPFTQGSTDYRQACRHAIRQGIMVNTVFCGNYQEGVQSQWKDGADLADGSYGAIDQDWQTPRIAAPQDAEILKLGQELNQTYIPYGLEGNKKKELQSVQDSNAAAACPAAIVERTMTKASGFYDTTVWDLVDRVQKEGLAVLEQLRLEELPPEMQKMTRAELTKLVTEKIKRREAIKMQLDDLNKARNVYVAKELQRQSIPDSFAAALVKAIRQQAGRKGFRL